MGGGGGATDVTAEVGELEVWGHWNDGPDMIMSRIRVSMGVLPTSRTKNNCSITCEETVLNEGRRNRSLPNRVGWFGYCVRQYSSSAHWDFSCICSMTWTSVNAGASTIEKKRWVLKCEVLYFLWGRGALKQRRLERKEKKKSWIHTWCKEHNGFHARVFCIVHMKSLEFLNLFLEDTNMIHEGYHPVGCHGRPMKSSSNQKGGHI